MAKGQFWDDTLEQLAELGQGTAKKTVKSVVSVFNPIQVVEGKKKDENNLSGQIESAKQKSKNHTPLDTEKLNKTYQNKNNPELESLRQRLFQMVKRDEEKVIFQNKQEEEEKKRKEEYERQEKKRKEQEKRLQEQSAGIPQGKKRRGLFSPKKKAIEQHAETKPSVGKQ